MILLDVPPMPFSDPISSVVGIGFFLFFAAIAVVSFVLPKHNHIAVRLILAVIFFTIAVIGSIIISFIVAQTQREPAGRPINMPISNSR